MNGPEGGSMGDLWPFLLYILMQRVLPLYFPARRNHSGPCCCVRNGFDQDISTHKQEDASVPNDNCNR